MDNLDKRDKFLETQSLPRLNHEKTENLSWLIASKVTESIIIIKKISKKKKKALNAMVSLVNSNKHLKKLLLIVFKFFTKTERNISFNKLSLPQYKTKKRYYKKKKQHT